MKCPDCGGPMWDNRQSKKSPKQPDYKCKDKQCDGVVWPEKRGDGSPTAASNSNGNGTVRPSGPLAPVYGECMEIASRAVKYFIGTAATPADVIAATATLFIAATQTDRPVKAATPKPKPAPPPPPPIEDDEPEYAEDNSLPF